MSTSTSTYIITFDSQGGSTVSSQAVEHGGKVTEPTAPTKEGYTFGGWYKESGCTSAWNFNTDTVTADVTLYAKWTPLYALRDTGPAGGLIFYVKEGGYSDGWMYLEAAPASTESTSLRWGSYGFLIGGTGTAIGTGQDNTTKIVAWLNGHSEINRAAQFCDDLVFYNCYGYICVRYDDWFLPSKDELNQMYLNLKVEGVGGFAGDNYWSSSEYNASGAWGQYFTIGFLYKYYKYDGNRVRAVRAF